MKVFLVMVLLAVSTSAYAAKLGLQEDLEKPSLKKAITPVQSMALKETGHTMETIGKILPDHLSHISAEDREKMMQVLKTMSTSEAKESDEYFMTTIISTLVTKLVSMGVAAAMG
uniref:Putative secreted protein n=1 Tax=Amblyomma aureolatum TaxID=187763 RepID=A0A1E1X1R8_9ACAR